MKIVLGTVQFGLQYGINSVGRPSLDEINSILVTANKHGISLLDTSAAYGESEVVLGQLLPYIDGEFRLISKYPKSNLTVEDSLNTSLRNLNVTSIYGYLLHHFDVYRSNPDIWNEFINLKKLNKVQKVGFSLYSTTELEILLNNDVQFDLIQIPYNIFDQQFSPYFEILKQRNVEIHVRSTFLQGLFFMDPENLPDYLLPLQSKLKELKNYAVRHQIEIAEVALNFNLQNPYIDGVLIGVDTNDQLIRNISCINSTHIDLNIEIKDKSLLNPVNWK